MAHAWIRPSVQLADTPVSNNCKAWRLCHGPSVALLPWQVVRDFHLGRATQEKPAKKKNKFFLHVQ